MSNRRKIRKPKRICEACQRGEHTGKPHLIDGTPILENAQRLQESIDRAISRALN